MSAEIRDEHRAALWIYFISTQRPLSQVSRVVGVSEATLRRAISGEVEPAHETIARLERAYETWRASTQKAEDKYWGIA